MTKPMNKWLDRQLLIMSEWVSEWVSEWLLFNANFSALSWWEQVNVQWEASTLAIVPTIRIMK